MTATVKFVFEDRDLGWSAAVDSLKRGQSWNVVAGIINDPEVAKYATINEFGAPSVRIPARPAYRAAFDENKNRYAEILTKSIIEVTKGKGLTYKRAFSRLGQIMAADLRASVEMWSDPPNEESTLDNKRRKAQGDSPLIATGRMLKTISSLATKGGTHGGVGEDRESL